MDHNDTKLVALTLEQGSQYYGKLVKRHADYLYGLGMRLTAGNHAYAQDMSQQAFIKAFNYLSSFDPNHPALGSNPLNRFRNWLTSIAVNCFRDMASDESRYAELSDEAIERLEQPKTSQTGDDFAALIRSLTIQDRQIVTLRFVYEYSIDEIAGMLGQKSGTIKSRLSRAVERLRNTINSDESRRNSEAQHERECYERV